MNTIAEKIYRLIRERSLGTDLSSLKQRGVRRVSVFKSNQLGDLVAMAVDQVLTDYGVKLSEGDLESLSEDGRKAFLNLLEERDSYKELVERFQKEQETLQIHRDVLERQIEREDSFLEDERGFWKEVPVGEGAEAVHARLREVLAHWLESLQGKLGPSYDPAAVKLIARMVESLGADLDEVFADTVGEIQQRYEEEGQRRIRTLERRVEKMRESLARAEDALARAEVAGPSEEGIASVYRGVQGISSGDKDYEQKRKMLQEIFQINKSIKEQIG